MKIIFVVIAVVLLLSLYTLLRKLNVSATNHPSIHKISSTQLREMLNNETDLQLVDVRTTLEYNKGYIKPAVNINFNENNFVEKFNSYNKEEPLYIYCRSGNRSGRAAKILADKGFTNICDLEGGILEWHKHKVI